MADKAQTPEAVALELFRIIAETDISVRNDKDSILTTYTECLTAVQGEYYPEAKSKPLKQAK